MAGYRSVEPDTLWYDLTFYSSLRERGKRRQRLYFGCYGHRRSAYNHSFRHTHWRFSGSIRPQKNALHSVSTFLVCESDFSLGFFTVFPGAVRYIIGFFKHHRSCQGGNGNGNVSSISNGLMAWHQSTCEVIIWRSYGSGRRYDLGYHRPSICFFEFYLH